MGERGKGRSDFFLGEWGICHGILPGRLTIAYATNILISYTYPTHRLWSRLPQLHLIRSFQSQSVGCHDLQRGTGREPSRQPIRLTLRQ